MTTARTEGPEAVLASHHYDVLPEEGEAEPTRQYEEVGPEAREEAGEAHGLRAEVAKQKLQSPEDPGPLRVEAKEVVSGGIQFFGFNQLGAEATYPLWP